MKNNKNKKINGIIDIDNKKSTSQAIDKKTDYVDSLGASAEFTNVD